MEKNDDFVNVAIRIRPYLSEDDKSLQIISNEQPVLYIPEKELSYSFDYVFSENCSQKKLYEKMVEPLVKQVLHGFNATVFAYGQTGTGKTYTMGTNFTNCSDMDCGIIMRALKDIMYQSEDKQNSIYISFYEIYNEKVYDLLGNFNVALAVKGFKINGLTKKRVFTCYDAEVKLSEGSKHRHIGETKQNNGSSRSHAIFTIYCHVKTMFGEIEAKLNLVDLAGSESVKKTGNQGNQLHEGININKGLLSIGQVINALSSNQSYIPYRQSKITTILQDSLNKKNFVTLIACVRPTKDDIHETVQTLDFAQRAKKVKSKPELNCIAMEYSKNNKIVGSTSKQKNILRTPLRQYKTPFKPKRVNLSAMKQKRALCSTLMSNAENENSQLSISMSSISTIQEPQISYSPIIKKCMDAMENTIMEKLETIVSKNLTTPLKEIKKTQNENLSWYQIQSTVSKLVKQEMDQLKADATTVKNNVVSNISPNKIRRSVKLSAQNNVVCNVLATPKENDKTIKNDEIKEDMDFNNASPISGGMSTPLFKMPECLPRKYVRKCYSIKTSSPIKTRRSVRLSAQKLLPVRRSERISCKISHIEIDQTPMQEVHVKVPVPTPRTKVPSTSKSKMIKDIQLSNTIKALEILNYGSEQEFLSFNSVGKKVAKMLYQYRKIKGTFNKISDLAGMPWIGKGYQRFVESNFLEEDEVFI